MEDQQSEAWYYSHDTQRTGPVTFHELQAKAKAGSLDPRLDLVWMQGMTDWKKAGEVDGLFERRISPEEKASFSTSGDPYMPPENESAEDAMLKEGAWPGNRRRSYLIATLIFPIAWYFGVDFATPYLAKEMEPALLANVIMTAGFVPLLVTLFVIFGRFANLGMSRWWVFGNLIPFLNIWLAYRCFACPAGYAYHKKMDAAGIFLAIVFWLLIVFGVLLVIGVIAVLFGMAGDPEIQKTIQDALQQIVPEASKP